MDTFLLRIWAVIDPDRNKGRYEARLQMPPEGEILSLGRTSDWANTRQGALLEGFADVLEHTPEECRLLVRNPYDSPAIRQVLMEDLSHRGSLYQKVFGLLNRRACRMVAADGHPEDRPFGLPWQEETPERSRVDLELLREQLQASQLETEAFQNRSRELEDAVTSLTEQLASLRGRLAERERPPSPPAIATGPDREAERLDLFADLSEGATEELRRRIGKPWRQARNFWNVLVEPLVLQRMVQDGAFGHESYALPAFTLARSWEVIANRVLADALVPFLHRDAQVCRVLRCEPLKGRMLLPLVAAEADRQVAKPRESIVLSLRHNRLSLRDLRLLLFDAPEEGLEPRPLELADRIDEFNRQYRAPWLRDADLASDLLEVNRIRNRAAHQDTFMERQEFDRLREILLDSPSARLRQLMDLYCRLQVTGTAP